MRYLRTYPWGMQLLLFFLMVFTFLSAIGAILLGVFQKLTGYQFTEVMGVNMSSPAALVHAALLAQGASSLFTFMLPAVTYAYLATPRPTQYLGLRMPTRPINLVLAALVILGAAPVLMLLENLISLINFGPSLKAAQEANDNMMKAFMNMSSPVDLIRSFVVMAIIPAVGEELFFRGTLMRFAKKRSRSMVFPIVFTAVVFAFVHSNVYGFVSILLAGVLLAVIYNLTGSLWCSILAHLLFNGSQVLLHYLGTSNAGVKAALESDTMPLYYAAIGAVVFAVSFYLLLKNRTPLPRNWADDFTPEELEQFRNDRKGRLF